MENNFEPWFVFNGRDISPPFDAGVIKGFEWPEGFPKCCKSHTTISESIDKWLEGFPKCCPYHIELSKKDWFKKQDFGYLKRKILTNFYFTEFHIKRVIADDNWYDLITDYIDYIVQSFGGHGVGSGRYLQLIKEVIEREVFFTMINFPRAKRQQLLKFLEEEHFHKGNPKDISDPNLLFMTYKRWLNSFPDLPVFQKIKKAQEKFTMVLMLKEPKFNPYLGVVKSKTVTNDELVELLVSNTKKILAKINMKEMIQQGLIKDGNSYKYDLIQKLFDARYDFLLGQYSEGEKKYVETLTEWLKISLDFLQAIEPLIGKVPQLKKAKKSSSRTNKESFLDLFKGNRERVDRFFKLLKLASFGALDSNNNWIYEGNLSSIVACFTALANLELIKTSYTTNKAKLRRVIESKINFKGNSRLFHDDFNQDEYDYFYKQFQEKLK